MPSTFSLAQGGQFRYINEQLYTQSGAESLAMMSRDPELFDAVCTQSSAAGSRTIILPWLQARTHTSHHAPPVPHSITPATAVRLLRGPTTLSTPFCAKCVVVSGLHQPPWPISAAATHGSRRRSAERLTGQSLSRQMVAVLPPVAVSPYSRMICTHRTTNHTSLWRTAQMCRCVVLPLTLLCSACR